MGQSVLQSFVVDLICCVYDQDQFARCLLVFFLADNDAILKHIKNVRGSVEVKRVFVQDIMKEAKRWKKKGLLEQLEEWLSQNLPQDSGPEGRKGGATVVSLLSGGEWRCSVLVHIPAFYGHRRQIIATGS